MADQFIHPAVFVQNPLPAPQINQIKLGLECNKTQTYTSFTLINNPKYSDPEKLVGFSEKRYERDSVNGHVIF
jgi:hypothetical protein